MRYLVLLSVMIPSFSFAAEFNYSDLYARGYEDAGVLWYSCQAGTVDGDIEGCGKSLIPSGMNPDWANNDDYKKGFMDKYRGIRFDSSVYKECFTSSYKATRMAAKQDQNICK